MWPQDFEPEGFYIGADPASESASASDPNGSRFSTSPFTGVDGPGMWSMQDHQTPLLSYPLGQFADIPAWDDEGSCWVDCDFEPMTSLTHPAWDTPAAADHTDSTAAPADQVTSQTSHTSQGGSYGPATTHRHYHL